MTVTPDDALAPSEERPGEPAAGAPVPRAPDRRVLAVLDVIGGLPVAEVAASSGFQPILLHRWVADFVAAGTAQVSNRPLDLQAAGRDRFLAAFAHELRTPLAVARGWAAMVADDELPPDMVTTAVGKLDAALAEVTHRVSDVEHLAAAALGRLQTHPQVTTVAEVVATAGPGIPGRVDGGDLLVTVDPDLASRVVHEMWLAAGSEPRPDLRRIEVSEEPTAWTVSVVREGPAIAIPVLQAMFEPFTANDDGTGVSIGLYLARALSVVLGGTIGVEQDDTRGRFWARFPRTAPAPATRT